MTTTVPARDAPRPVPPREPSSGTTDSLGTYASEKLLSLLSERIARDLQESPLHLSVAQHRKLIAHLLGHQAQMNHYELLGIASQASEQTVHTAYVRLARRIHPSHAEALGLAGKAAILELLFERTTDAYLTLSDPKRRSAYDTAMGIWLDTAIDEVQRKKEKKILARRNHRLATFYMSKLDFSVVVDLMTEAVRLDPQPEYHVLLAQAQARNPYWREMAIDNLRQAIRLRPDPETCMQLGKLLEEEGLLEEARTEYRQLAKKEPDHLEARLALDRIGWGGLLSRTLFGRGKRQAASAHR